MSDLAGWYVVKQSNGQCSIELASDVDASGVDASDVDASEIDASDVNNSDADNSEVEPLAHENASAVARWGPYKSQPEAIARRVGLIRAGKCQPV